jgi:hypothetical protein
MPCRREVCHVGEKLDLSWVLVVSISNLLDSLLFLTLICFFSEKKRVGKLDNRLDL